MPASSLRVDSEKKSTDLFSFIATRWVTQGVMGMACNIPPLRCHSIEEAPVCGNPQGSNAPDHARTVSIESSSFGPFPAESAGNLGVASVSLKHPGIARVTRLRPAEVSFTLRGSDLGEAFLADGIECSIHIRTMHELAVRWRAHRKPPV